MHIHEEQQYREKKRATIVQTIFYGEIKVENKKKKKKGKKTMFFKQSIRIRYSTSMRKMVAATQQSH